MLNSFKTILIRRKINEDTRVYENATNVYRTEKYIVKQDIFVEQDVLGNSGIYSNDTYYLRNKKLDKEFEFLFKNRDCVNGKRVHSTIYKRKYFKN